MSDKPDVISIGDIVTDVFIKLYENQAHQYDNEQGSWLAIPFATKIPYDTVDTISGVGNAANAAVTFARLGLNSAFATNVGDDQIGRDMISAMHDSKVDSRFIRINPDRVSNVHYVLRYQVERTILIKHEAYDYHWPHLRPNELPKWVYFSSVSEHAMDYHDQIADWLEQNKEVKMAFQPGTFQIEAGVDRLKRIYQNTEVLIVNREEAVEITGGNYHDYHDLLNRMHELGANIAVITDGPNGAVASDGKEVLKMPLYPDPAPPVDRTGAGDAFASTFVAALIKGNTISGALQWAPINSMSVLQKVGAQAGLLNEAELEQYLAQSPPNYISEQL
jgi:ribokinase